MKTYNKGDRVYIETISKFATVHHQPRAQAAHISILIDGNSRAQYIPVSEIREATAAEGQEVQKRRAQPREEPAAPSPTPAAAPVVELAREMGCLEPSFEQIVAERNRLGSAIVEFDRGVQALFRKLVGR